MSCKGKACCAEDDALTKVTKGSYGAAAATMKPLAAPVKPMGDTCKVAKLNGSLNGGPVQGHQGRVEQEPLLETTTSRVRIQNLCCEMEVGLVKSLIQPMDGCVDVKVSAVGRIAIIKHRDPLSSQSILDTLNAAHLGASLQDTAVTIHDRHSKAQSHVCAGCLRCLKTEWRGGLPWTLLALGVGGLAATVLVDRLGGRWKWVVGVPFVAVCGGPLMATAISRLISGRLDVNVLMVVAILGALVTGDVVEALAVIVVVMGGDRVRDWGMQTVATMLQDAGGRLAPQMATLVDGLEVPVESIEVGAMVRVRAGEAVPVDGTVTRGNAAVDESAITGESYPVEKAVGSTVSGGTICQSGSLEVRCTTVASQSSIARIRDMVQEIALTRSPTQELVDAFAQYYTPTVVLLAFLLAVTPPLLYGTDWSESIYRSLEVLVLGCPCALVLSAPLPMMTSLAASANLGHVLFKSVTALETLGKVQVLACDKTGTLTEGRLQVTGRHTLEGAMLDSQLTLHLATSVEALSSHPLAAAVLSEGLGCVTTSFQNGGPKSGLAQVYEYKMMEGVGVSGRCVVGGRQYNVVVGNDFLLEDQDGWEDDEKLNTFLHDHTGEAKLYVLVNGVVEMVLAVADNVREAIPHTIRTLHKLKVETALLTGDSDETAMRVQNLVGLGSVQVRMKPADKLAWIRAAQQGAKGKKRIVAMVGDGINDGPSLMAADVGISMGAGGTALAVASSDIVLMTDSIRSIPQAIRMSRAVNRVVMENIVLAVGIKAAILVLVMLGKARLWLAVASDGLSLLAVVLNGLKPLCIARWVFRDTDEPLPAETRRDGYGSV